MNKHILLVMQWLKDKDSVSREKLSKNRHHLCGATANAAYANVVAAVNSHAKHTVYAAYAEYWVDEYFKTTGENKEEYLKELER